MTTSTGRRTRTIAAAARGQARGKGVLQRRCGRSGDLRTALRKPGRVNSRASRGRTFRTCQPFRAFWVCSTLCDLPCAIGFKTCRTCGVAPRLTAGRRSAHVIRRIHQCRRRASEKGCCEGDTRAGLRVPSLFEETHYCTTPLYPACRVFLARQSSIRHTEEPNTLQGRR